MAKKTDPIPYIISQNLITIICNVMLPITDVFSSYVLGNKINSE